MGAKADPSRSRFRYYRCAAANRRRADKCQADALAHAPHSSLPDSTGRRKESIARVEKARLLVTSMLLRDPDQTAESRGRLHRWARHEIRRRRPASGLSTEAWAT